MAKSVFNIDNSGGSDGGAALNPFDNGVFVPNPGISMGPAPGLAQGQLGPGGGRIEPGTDPAGLYYTTQPPAQQTPQAQQGGNPSTSGGGGSSSGGSGSTVPSGPSSFFSNWNTYSPGGVRGAPGALSPTGALAGLSFGQAPPAYQGYTFTQQGIQPTVNTPAPTFGALPNRPNVNAYTAGTINPFQAAGNNYDVQLQQLIAQMMGSAQPNAAAMKEASKETLLKTNQDNLDQMMQSAAGRGTLHGGTELQNELQQRQDFAGNLTKSYRDIELAAQQQGFDNSLAGGQFLGNLAAQQATTAQNNYSTGLQGQQLQEQMRQAAASSALAVQNAQDSYNQVKAQHELAVAQFGLDYANAQFGQQLQSAQFNLTQQQAQAQQNQAAAQMGLDRYLGVGNLNLNLAQAQSGDEIARNTANWNQALGGAQFGLQEQGFGLDLQQAAFNEWLSKQNLGLQGRGLDLQQSQAENAANAAYVASTRG